MTDLITTGTLPIPQARTLVADQITAYLEQHHKSIDEQVLEWMTGAFKKSVVKQLMSSRDTRKGYESCTVYSGACARKSRLQYDGIEGEPLQARSLLKFVLGDLVELAVVGIAQLAGVEWHDNNRDLYIFGRDGVKVNVHPDGRLIDCGQYYNAEVKSCDSRTFDGWLEHGGPDDKWGYLTQASVEIAAWREAGYDVNSTCFVAVSTGSRQGSIAEWMIPYDQTLVDQWHRRRQLARGVDLPPVPFEAEPETDFVKGKMIDVDQFTHGDPVPRYDKNGKIHGYDVPTGRKILPLYCSYCAYKQHCWPGAVLDVDNGKPKWVVPCQP